MISGAVFPGDDCRGGGICPPGVSIPVVGHWAGTDLPGTVKIQGRTFAGVGAGIDAPAQAQIVLTGGTFTMPPQADEATVTAPFELEGLFTWFESTETLWQEFEGSGVATLFLVWSPLDLWHVTAAHLEIRRGR